jgi:ketosteroid isomerase-like protein
MNHGALPAGRTRDRLAEAPNARRVKMSDSSAGEVVTRFYEDFAAGNIEAALAACAEDLEVIDPGMGTVRGHGRFRTYLETFKRAMPDARAVVEHTVEAADTVAVEGRFTGTHTGPLATDEGDVAPTGLTIDLRFADIARVRDHKIVAYHTYYGPAGLLTQLGLRRAARAGVSNREPTRRVPVPRLRL